MRLSLVLSEAGQGLRRNFSMVVSIVLVTFVSLTFVGAATLLQMQIGQMKTYWYDKAQVAVYLCNGTETTHCASGEKVTKTQAAAVKAALESPALKPFVKSATFETQQQAFTKFKAQFKGSAVADYVTADFLNETYWVNLKDPSQSLIISDAIADLPGVDAVTDQRTLLDQIFAVLNTASLTAGVIAALMLVAAALLIATTIRLSAYSRRKEIGIMRLVGASNRFIQTPFILEGVLAALVGSALAGAATVAIVKFFVQGYLAQSTFSIAFVTVPDALIVVPILVGVGVILAAFSANIAISRYLKV